MKRTGHVCLWWTGNTKAAAATVSNGGAGVECRCRSQGQPAQDHSKQVEMDLSRGLGFPLQTIQH